MTKNYAHIEIAALDYSQSPGFYIKPLQTINTLSVKLASDILLVIRRAYGYELGWAYKEPNARKRIILFADYLTILIDKLGDDATPLIQRGLTALTLEPNYWIKIESCSEAVSSSQGIPCGEQPISRLSEAILYLARSFEDNRDLLSPSFIRLSSDSKAFTLAPLYQISSKLLIECKSLLLTYLKSSSRPEEAEKKINPAVTGLLTAAQNERLKSGLLAEGIKYIASDAHNCITALNTCNERHHHKAALAILLRECSPYILGPNKKGIPNNAKSLPIEYKGINNDLKGVHWVSPKMAQQAQEYLVQAAKKSDTYLMGNSPKEFVSNFPSVGNILFELKGRIELDDWELIRSKGAPAFLDNEGKLLRWFWELYQSFESPEQDIQKETSIKPTFIKISLQRAYSALTGLLSFIEGRKVHVKRYYPFYLEFPHEGDPHDARFYSIQYIHENYPELSRDLIRLKHKMIGSLDHNARSTISVFSFFRTLKPLIEQCDELLTSKEKKSLATLGARAFTLNQHRIMKKFLEQIQQRFKSENVCSETAHFQQKTLKEFVTFFGLPSVESFPINAGRAGLFLEQQKNDDYYTLNEVSLLAFHIESLLAKNDISNMHQLWLRTARIILKTNWNPSPVTNLAIDDLFEVEFAGRRSFLVRLFKPRAGYKTQWNRFDIETKNLLEEDVKIGKEVIPVIKDLQFIMHNLTSHIRNSLPEKHPFKNALMIYNDSPYGNGRTKKLTDNSLKRSLNSLLKKNGCPIPFVPRKIRKGGLNFIYRQVAKDFSKYRVAANHSWKVFRMHYFKYDCNAAEETLSKATSIMGDYFHGRPITEKLQIVTETEQFWQQTPNGKCASQGNDEQARAYSKAHHSLFRALSIDENDHCADFNACLWCEHYRGIADVEHAYRLLSYRDFVITDMEASIGESLNTGLQKDFVKQFRLRVNEVLADIDAITPGCQQAAEEYLAKHGIHPDWSLVSTTSTM